MTKDTTQKVTKSRQAAQKAGRKRLSAILSPEHTKLFQRLKGEDGETDLIEKALEALERARKGDAAPDVPTILEQLAADLRARKRS